jgi:hypothetical protein
VCQTVLSTISPLDLSSAAKRHFFRTQRQEEIRRRLVVGSIVILIIAIVVACVVGGCGKTVEGVCMPYENDPNDDSSIIRYCVCAVANKLYRPQSAHMSWEWQRRECEAAVKCESGLCQLPPDRRNP